MASVLPSTLRTRTPIGGYHWNELMAPRSEVFEIVIPYRCVPGRGAIMISNTSDLGVINSFEWYPPMGVRVLEVAGSTKGHCTLTGLKGFGGNQFPTVILYPNIHCDKLDLRATELAVPGERRGAVTISFVTDSRVRAFVSGGDARLRPHSRLPQAGRTRPLGVPDEVRGVSTDDRARAVVVRAQLLMPQPQQVCLHSQGARMTAWGFRRAHVSGTRRKVLTEHHWTACRTRTSRHQLVTVTRWVRESPPAACRIRLVSARNPSTFKVYVFWIPWLAAAPLRLSGST